MLRTPAPLIGALGFTRHIEVPWVEEIMSSSFVRSTIDLFVTRLTTLENLVTSGEAHLAEGAKQYLSRRLAPDMYPLGTQIAFTCNQPRNFTLWLKGRPSSDLDPEVRALETALRYIRDTKDLLVECLAPDEGLPSDKHLDLGPGLHADLTGHQYVSEFLVPNFYFHLVTSYAILRMAGVPVGKRDYMAHLLPHVKQSET